MAFGADTAIVLREYREDESIDQSERLEIADEDIFA
jgi:hypothetical protein